jgi:hypothetical protein
MAYTNYISIVLTSAINPVLFNLTKAIIDVVASSLPSANITNATSFDAPPLSAATPNPQIPDQTWETFRRYLFLILVPVLFLGARWQLQNPALTAAATQRLQARWDVVWQTNDWHVLYGLISFSNENKWGAIYTPFWSAASVYNIWLDPSRSWLKRLLAMGGIPLLIQDGSMTTHRVNFTGFGRQKRFPWFVMPRYQQSKGRAYFEFLVPYPERSQKMMAFLQDIVHHNNDMLGVTMRRGPPDRGRIEHSMDHPPASPEHPMVVGAQSKFAALLPFMRNTVLKDGFGERMSCLM